MEKQKKDNSVQENADSKKPIKNSDLNASKTNPRNPKSNDSDLNLPEKK